MSLTTQAVKSMVVGAADGVAASLGEALGSTEGGFEGAVVGDGLAVPPLHAATARAAVASTVASRVVVRKCLSSICGRASRQVSRGRAASGACVSWRPSPIAGRGSLRP